MSCQRASNQVSGQAGLATGLTRLSGSLSYSSGLIAAGVDRLGQAVAPGAGAALKLMDPPDSRTRRQKAVLVGTLAGLALRQGPGRLLKLGGQALPVVRTVQRATAVSERLTGTLGSVAGSLSRTDPAGQVSQEKRVLFFFKAKPEVSLWRSRLTPLLNRYDRLGSAQPRHSEGLLFETKGLTWHQGTQTLTMGGGSRTVSHLQSLSYPARHLYFDRPLSQAQAVGLAGEQLQPSDIPGFVGRISRTESLCPAWAEVKKAMILTRLHWPPEAHP